MKQTGAKPRAWKDFFKGFACFGQGLVKVAANPSLLGLGILPPFFCMIMMTAGVVGLNTVAPSWAQWLAPAAWLSGMVRHVVVGLLTAMIMVAGVLLLVLTFTTVTLMIGAPFYEKISANVDQMNGFVFPEGNESVASMLRRIAADTARSLALSLGCALLAFGLGLIPVLGQILSPLVAAWFGAWLITLELLEPALTRRGLPRLSHRRTWLKPRRALMLGFGVPIYLCMLIPLLNVMIFPGAVAGATIMAQQACETEPVLSD